MKKDTWSEKYGCFECSYCNKPQGNYCKVFIDLGTIIRYCKDHEKEYYEDKTMVMEMDI